MVASSSHCTKFTQTTLMNCRQLKHTTTLWENVLRRHGKLKFVNNGDLNDKSRTRKNRLRVELKVGLWNCQQMKAYNDALEHKETYGIANNVDPIFVFIGMECDEISFDLNEGVTGQSMLTCTYTNVPKGYVLNGRLRYSGGPTQPVKFLRYKDEEMAKKVFSQNWNERELGLFGFGNEAPLLFWGNYHTDTKPIAGQREVSSRVQSSSPLSPDLLFLSSQAAFWVDNREQHRVRVLRSVERGDFWYRSNPFADPILPLVSFYGSYILNLKILRTNCLFVL
ncbi:hypothetical protein ACFX2I_026096 [Malus domestica]